MNKSRSLSNIAKNKGLSLQPDDARQFYENGLYNQKNNSSIQIQPNTSNYKSISAMEQDYTDYRQNSKDRFRLPEGSRNV